CKVADHDCLEQRYGNVVTIRDKFEDLLRHYQNKFAPFRALGLLKVAA
ncbi:MAG: hypothetical protein ACI9MB_004366, partial [Verrucomicrobiales bacterium]